MAHPHHLETVLRQLRLSGMLDTLDARLTQARNGDLGHVEFLQALCEDEIARRDATAITRRVRAARFEQPTTLEDFDFNFNPSIPAATIRDLAALRFLTTGESILLHGPVGVGKTFIAQAIGHHACRHGHSVVFTKTSRLLADLAGGHADRTWHTRLRRWAKPELLVLDDFAMRDFTPPQADDLYELVTERAGQSIVITSNRKPEDWYPLFPNPVVAESILDRLINTAHHIHMTGRSYRPNHRPGQPPTTTDDTTPAPKRRQRT
jgi:DNA replication protein DnaC